MKEVNLQILEELKSFVRMIKENQEYLECVSTCDNAFSRSRKLTFDRLLLFILKLSNKTLSIDLDDFFEDLGSTDSVTASAFCQQRAKLNALVYHLWNQVLVKSFYYYGERYVKRWRGFRLVGVDGSNLPLVHTKALKEAFGGQSNQHGFFVQAKTLYCYDLLNNLVIHSELASYNVGEETMAYSFLEHVMEPDMLGVYDRNYCSYKMMALHMWQEQERKFVIRANEHHNWIRDFMKSKKQEETVYLTPDSSSMAQMRKAGYIVSEKDKLPIRLVRIELEDGGTEVLATNLRAEEDVSREDLKRLYAKRWGVETEIGKEKNIMGLESFSGLTPHSVTQDFYATVMLSNLQSLFIKPAQAQIDKKQKHYKHPMKINNNKSYGKLKKYLVPLFLIQDPATILKRLYRYFQKYILPVRPERSFPRERKNKHLYSKHKTYTNYKPAA